ncbi:MAG: antitoxin Xre/MbcA/ParS toxin-binding domain-containing protein [Gemmatimonadota bacterium]
MHARTRELHARKAKSVVTWAHDRLGFTFEDVGEAVGASKRTVFRGRSGATAPRRDNEERLSRLDELRFWIQEVFGDDRAVADEWLRTRLRDLNGKTPLESVLAGNVEKVSELLSTYRTGAFV